MNMIENQPFQPIDSNPIVNESLTSPEKKSSSVIGLIILVLLLLAAIGFLVFQNSQLKQKLPKTIQAIPTPTKVSPTLSIDQTDNWKAYSTSTYSVKYPSDIIVQEAEASVLVLSKWGPTQKEATEFYDGINIRFQPFEIPNVDLASYVQEKIQKIKEEGNAEVTSGPNEIKIGRYTGLTYTSHGLGTYKYIYLQSPDKIMLMEIVDGTNDPSKQDFQQTTNKILSTFEFVE